jgi:ribosomal protein S18 acetylase RimI-like enzyme
MTITVRPVGTDDLPALRTLFLEARRKTFAWQTSDTFQLADFDAQTRDESILAAEDERGRICGFISVWKPDRFIHHLYVDQQCSGRGIGRALLRQLPEWCNTRYRLKCLRINVAALAFYEACDFVQIGSGTSEEGAYLLLESSGAHDRQAPFQCLP